MKAKKGGRRAQSAAGPAVPIRQCMGCRNRLPKRELLRVVRPPEGEVRLDMTGKAQGRGVYLCRDANCFKRVRKSRALERSLQTSVPEGIFAEIEELCRPAEGEKSLSPAVSEQRAEPDINGNGT